ncbi:MAG: hypothetical protein ABH812_04035 [bacterium]
MATKRNLLYLLIIFIFLSSISYVKAQSNKNSPTVSSEMKMMKEERIQELEAKREKLKQKVQERTEELKQKREETQQEIKTRKEEMKQKKEEFKNKIKEIKDNKKKTIVERVDNKISSLNKKHTDRFTKLVDKLNSILLRVEDKKDELKAKGIDVVNLEPLIQTAKDSISNAEKEISAQMEKDYVVEIDIENNLGSVVSTTFKEFKDDISQVHDSIKTAKEAVQESANALKELIVSSTLNDGSTE